MLEAAARAFDREDWRQVVLICQMAAQSERSSLRRAFYARLNAWACAILNAGAFYAREGD